MSPCWIEIKKVADGEQIDYRHNNHRIWLRANDEDAKYIRKILENYPDGIHECYYEKDLTTPRGFKLLTIKVEKKQ